MALMTISEVARRVGLRPSAIRYYEEVGILQAADRVSGQRRYDSTVLYRLAIIRRARDTGFTLEQIRQLFFGFREGTTAGARWSKMSEAKLTELAIQAEQIRQMQELLVRLQKNCRCVTLDQCGKAMFQRLCGEGAKPAAERNRRFRR